MAGVGAHLEELRTIQRDKFFIIYDVLHNWEEKKNFGKFSTVLHTMIQEYLAPIHILHHFFC